MLNDKGLYRAMKQAYKAGGYTVGRMELEGDIWMIVAANQWMVICPAENFPRNCLGLVVEHAGMLETGTAMKCEKDNEQTVMPELVQGFWKQMMDLRKQNAGYAVRTPVWIGGLQVWQDAENWNVLLMDPAHTAICQEGDDVEIFPVGDGLLFEMPDASVFVLQESGEHMQHLVEHLEKLRIT